MKIKGVSFLLVVLLMLALVSGGVMAAEPVTHDISKGDVIIPSCGDNCPGHVITGDTRDIKDNSSYNIRILSGDHKITLKDLYVHCSYPNPMNDDRINDGSGLYIADAVGNVELTIEGEVYFHNVYGLYSAADKLTILGNETSELFLSGKYEGAHVKNDFVMKGGYTYFGTASYPGADAYKPHLRGLVAEGTATFEDAEIEATASGFPKTDAMNQVYSGGAEGGVASAGIDANELVVNNSLINARCGSVAYKEGTEPYSIAIDAETMDVSGSEIRATGGESYNSFGISCAKNANFVNSDVTAYGGTAENESNGFDAYFANVGALNSTFDLNGGTSDYISIGGCFNMLDVVDSTVDGYGGESVIYSAGLYGGTLSAEKSEVNGYGGVATDPNVVEDVAAFSGGISFGTINGIDSNIYGLGEKAMISNGIRTTEITVKGGLIEGRGDDEGEESFGIFMEPSQMDDGTEIPVKFDIVGGDVIANGGTFGLMVADDNFAGVSYKADENAEAKVTKDFADETFLFGNQYKVIYAKGDVKTATMPADGAYHRDEVFLLPKEGPTADGYQFVGWEDENGFFFKAEDNNYVSMSNEDMVFTAVWKCLGGKDCVLHEFNDLDPKLWYHDGIEYCYNLKVMQGMSKNTFEPYTETTRAMVVTALYRFAAEPETEGNAKFSDVKEGTWYTDAVKWASEIGLVAGYPDGTFRPDRIATREELAVFLYRYADYMELNLEREPLPDTFTDKDEVSLWALPAMEWAVTTADIINGVDETTLSPKTHANRAQLATMIQRLNDFFLSEFAY